MFQSTIARESRARRRGAAYRSPRPHPTWFPAPADTGIVFRRADLDNFAIEAQGQNVARVSYATSLMKQGVLLSTTEHLLAAIYSCGIDNIYIDIDSIEIPILDGSAEPFMADAGTFGDAPAASKTPLSKVLSRLKSSRATAASASTRTNNFMCAATLIFRTPKLASSKSNLR